MAAFEETVKALVDLGFPEDKSRAALQAVDPPTVDNAVEFLVANEDNKGEDGQATAQIVRSYRCVDTGKLFRTMQDAQLYAERTGHTNFEESDVEVPPLTEEEKKEKLDQIRERIKQKRAEREEQEKEDEKKRELARRKGGQEMAQYKEEHERIQRELAYEKRRKEKELFQKERERLKNELAKDKAERAADAARRRGETPDQIREAFQKAWDKAMGVAPKSEKEKEEAAKSAADKIETAIHDLSQYRAGGDGLRALKTLKKMVVNIVENPTEEKFKHINLQNEAFKKRVASLVGGVAFLKACGFTKDPLGEKLTLEDEDLNVELLKDAVSRLEKAISTA